MSRATMRFGLPQLILPKRRRVYKSDWTNCRYIRPVEITGDMSY
jgi:hypothetical protein